MAPRGGVGFSAGFGAGLTRSLSCWASTRETGDTTRLAGRGGAQQPGGSHPYTSGMLCHGRTPSGTGGDLHGSAGALQAARPPRQPRPPRPLRLPPRAPPGVTVGSLTLSLWKGFKKLVPISASSRGVPGGLVSPAMLLGELCKKGGGGEGGVSGGGPGAWRGGRGARAGMGGGVLGVMCSAHVYGGHLGVWGGLCALGGGSSMHGVPST